MTTLRLYKKKWCEYTEIKKKPRVHLREGIKTYNSAWEAAEGLLPLGIKTSVSEDERLAKELQRIGWQAVGMSGPRRGGVMTRSLFKTWRLYKKTLELFTKRE